jgi:hypothetical protein
MKRKIKKKTIKLDNWLNGYRKFYKLIEDWRLKPTKVDKK